MSNIGTNLLVTIDVYNSESLAYNKIIITINHIYVYIELSESCAESNILVLIP